MTDVSRRKFLAASGAGAIAAGVVSVTPLASASAAGADDFAAEHPEPFEESPLIVTVDDLKAGRISVMHGEQEFSVVDTELAGRIASLARTGA
jgi:CHASE2 domain-containing sensor protein